MRLIIFALISATLFACSPIENEPMPCPAPVGGGDSVITPDTVSQGYDFGFYYGKSYLVTVYEEGQAPVQESIVFVNDSVATSPENGTFTSVWNEDGVVLELSGQVFDFYYNAKADALIWATEPDLTVVISKFN